MVPVMVRGAKPLGNRSAAGSDGCAARRWPGRLREVAVPGDELAAFAVAADPFEFAALGPVGGHLGGGGEFDGGVGRLVRAAARSLRRLARSIRATSCAGRLGRRSGSMCQAAMPSRSNSATSIVRTTAPVFMRGEVGRRLGRDRRRWRSRCCGEGDQVAADAAAEVGDPRGSRPARLAMRSDGFVGGDPFVGGLFEADAGEEHPVRLGKLCRRAAAQLDLFEQQMRLGG